MQKECMKSSGGNLLVVFVILLLRLIILHQFPEKKGKYTLINYYFEATFEQSNLKKINKYPNILKSI